MYIEQAAGLTPLKPVHPSLQGRAGGFLVVSGGGYWVLEGKAAAVQLSDNHHPHLTQSHTAGSCKVPQ
jgi:hypothetical protein